MGGCDVVAMLRMAGMVCLELVLQARPFPCMSWVCWSKLCCEILLLLNMADMDCLYVKGCGVSSANYS